MARLATLLAVFVFAAANVCIQGREAEYVRHKRNPFRTAQTPVTETTEDQGFAPEWSRKKRPMKLLSLQRGDNADMKCQSEGNPKPDVVWYKDGNRFEERKCHGCRLKMRGHSLQLFDLIESDAGLYTCNVSNIYGSISWTYQVAIHVSRSRTPPFFVKSPENQTIHVGEDAKLECRILSTSSVQFHWLKHYSVNGSWVNEKDEMYFNVVSSTGEQEGQEEDAHITDLIIKNVTMEDAGQYTCYVVNTYTEGHRSAWLEVLPAKPKATELTITVSRPADVQLYVTIIVSVVVVGVVIAAVIITILLVCRRRRTKHRMRLPLQPNPFYNDLRARGVEFDITSDPKWEIPRSNVELGELLGEGAFGRVRKGYVMGLWGKMEPTIVAVKMLKQDAGDSELIGLAQEMQVMKDIGVNKNVIDFMGCCTQDGPLWVLVEYATYGNLRDFMRTARRSLPQVPPPSNGYEHPRPCGSNVLALKPLTCLDLVKFSYQVARAMVYLSEKKILHRDLAARNILVADNYVLKVADFGLTRSIADRDYYTKSGSGRLPVKWMSPEALFDRKYSTKSDVWSYGILLWEIMTLGGNPYPTVPVENLFELLKNGHRMERPANASVDIYNLMLKCWQYNPHERPNFSNIETTLDEMLLDMSSQNSDTKYLTLEEFHHDESQTVTPQHIVDMPLDTDMGDDEVFEAEDVARIHYANPRRSDSQYSSLSSNDPSSTPDSTPNLNYRQIVSAQMEPRPTTDGHYDSDEATNPHGQRAQLFREDSGIHTLPKTVHFTDNFDFYSDPEDDDEVNDIICDNVGDGAEEEEDPLSCLERDSPEGATGEQNFEESVPVVRNGDCKQTGSTKQGINTQQDSKEPLMQVFYSSDKVECVTMM